MEKTNILVVYDPTKEAQPALERAVSIAEATPCNLHVFCCIHADIPKNADKATTVRQQLDEQRAVIEQTVAELEPGSTEVTIGLEWDKDWYQAVVRASISKNADVVLKSTYRHSVGKRILNRSSDWTLRGAKDPGGHRYPRKIGCLPADQPEHYRFQSSTAGPGQC
jgi:universal stress protein E